MDREALLTKLKKEFKNSTNSWNEPDELGLYTKGAIRRFITAHEHVIQESLKQLKENPKLLETNFFKLKIGEIFIKRKIYSEMLSNIRDLGEEFLTQNIREIWKAVDHMYQLYYDDDDLNDLRTAQADWYREILWDFIKTDPDDDE